MDELKKGPFTLQAGVLTYRQTEACVEVDIRLSATSRTGSLVWESVLTLVSQDKQQGSTIELGELPPSHYWRFNLFKPGNPGRLIMFGCFQMNLKNQKM